MEVLTLITAARGAGLRLDITASGHLIIKGPTCADHLARALGQRKPEVVAALRRERSNLPPRPPDIKFHDELACWPIAWRGVWGHITNAVEDVCKAEGVSSEGVDLGTFALVDVLRREGMTPDNALLWIWKPWELPGRPPVLGSEVEGRTLESTARRTD